MVHDFSSIALIAEIKVGNTFLGCISEGGAGHQSEKHKAAEQPCKETLEFRVFHTLQICPFHFIICEDEGTCCYTGSLVLNCSNQFSS